MTSIQIIDKILSEVNGCKKDVPNRNGDKNSGHFYGQIGHGMTFSGEWSGVVESNTVPYKYAIEKVWISMNDQKLLSLVMKRSGNEYNEKHHQLVRTLYEIYTPRCGSHGRMSKDGEALKQLRVFHAADETMDSVMDQLLDAYAYSKASLAYDRKYHTLNIATRLANLKNKSCDAVVNDLFDEITAGEAFTLPNADNDSEPRVSL